MNVQTDIRTDKTALRQRLRAQRQGLEPSQVHRLSTAICLHARQLTEFTVAHTVAFYQPIDHEVDPAPLLIHALTLGKEVFLPVVNRTARALSYHPHDPAEPLRPGTHGIPEPPRHGPGLTGAGLLGLELMLIPLVGYDGEGYRLGFGGGYFDRALGVCTGLTGRRPVLAGLAYRFQEVSRLPREPHDIRLDLVVHEDGIRRFC